MSLAETEEPPINRADAQRNRQRLVAAARQAFTSGQGTVSLESVARAAGVGIGTLYRHFPTREALVEAVYRAEVASLCDSADELLATHEPDVALRTWMDRFADYVATKRGIVDALRPGAIAASRSREQLAAAAKTLLAAGAAAGTLRDDVRPEDVVVGLVGIFLACGSDQREQSGRLLDLLVAGLRESTVD